MPASMSEIDHTAMCCRNLRQVAEIIRQFRDVNNAALAKEVGVSEKVFNNQKQGLARPQPHMVYMLKRLYGVTADWIYLQDRSGLPEWIRVRLRDDLL